MKNIELEFTNANENPETPIDAYVEHLQTLVPSLCYDMQAAEKPSCPVFTIVDNENSFCSTLRRAEGDNLIKYALTVTTNGGDVAMSSTEWTIPGASDSPLCQLYQTLYDACMQVTEPAEAKKTSVETDPGTEPPESLLIDDFIAALTADAKSPHPVIHWEQAESDSEDEYVARSFGDSQCTIHLTKNRLEETDCRFTLRYEDFGGGEVFSAVESCVKWEDSELGKLYRLVVNRDTPSDIILPMQDAERFVHKAKVAAMFDRIVADAFPSVCQPNPETGENMVLVHDIFAGANLNIAVRYCLDEIHKRHPEMPPSRLLQLQIQAECIGKIIRHSPRCPNGAAFIDDALPAVICNGRPWQGKTVTTSNSLSKISNAWTIWLDILGSRNSAPLQRIMTKHAALLLTIIMMEHTK